MRVIVAAILLLASATPKTPDLGKDLLFHAGFDGSTHRGLRGVVRLGCGKAAALAHYK